MSRLSRPVQKSTNPSKKFIEWKSKDKCFSYYDKEKEENISLELPLKFIFLEHYHTVGGWNDASGSRIFSNEVFQIGTEELAVKSFKGGEIAKGIYKEIKHQISSAGGVYHRSIYVMLENGELVNIKLKGSAVSRYSDFYQDHHQLIDQNWIEVNSAEDGKKGAVSYSMPVFTIGEVVTAKENKLVDKIIPSLQDYVDTYKAKGVDVVEEIEVEADVPSGKIESLPF